MRLCRLEVRPVHTDEAVCAFQIGGILHGEIFHYTSIDYHGPLYFGLSGVCARIAGASSLATMNEASLRWPAVICSLLLFLLIPPLSRFIGMWPAILAGFLWALNPIAVYYGRYAIPESLFVALSMAFLLALPAALQSRDWKWQAACGALAGLMLATKETAILSIAAAFLASSSQYPWSKNGAARGLLIGICAAVAVALPCFTWGFQNPHAVLDLLAAARNYLHRAAGQGHEKIWFYYGNLLLTKTYSGPVLVGLGAVGTGLAWSPGLGNAHPPQPFARYLGLYTGTVFIFYTLIPYKTPWLLLSVVIPLGILAALALGALWQKSAWLFLLATALLLGSSAWDVKYLCFKLPADERNPLAYSHTLPDLADMPLAIERWKEQHGHPPTIAVLANDPWPLPWYLRRFPMVGYWTKSTKPKQLPATDLLIIESGIAADMESKELEGWRPTIFGQRPGVLLILYRRNEPGQP